MATVDVLVAGEKGVGKATLLSSLQATPCAGQGPGLYDLRLDTKYYTADLLVRCQQIRKGTGTADAGSLLDLLQALVLVIDASSSSSYEAAVSYYKSLGEREFEIQLLIANKLDVVRTAACPAWLEAARTWCYSNGFEYIEAAAGNPSLDTILQEGGEQQGVARVLSALHAHMWPNMVQQVAQQHSNRPSQAAETGGANSTRGSTGTKDQGQTTAAAAADLLQQPDHTLQPGQGGAVDAVPTAQELQACAPSQHAGSTTSGAGKPQPTAGEQQQQQPSSVIAAAAVGASEDDPFLEADDDFEQLMRQVMGARARLSTLADGERRAAAADLALKLSRMMGLGDDDDDDEGDSGSEGGSGGVQAASDDRQPQLDATH